MIDPRAPDYENTPVSPRRPRFGYAPADLGAEPVVSIVTPYYNTGAIFHETARSILGQSLQQWEWIIVNDASTDAEALAVLSEYRGRDPRIQVIDHEVNRGLSGARNTGFRAARTEFVFQIDSDDLMEPTAIEKMLWFLHAHPGVAFVNAWSVAFGGQQYLWSRGFEEGDRFLSQNVATNRALIRKSAFLAAGGYDEAIRGGMEDWDFWLRCANQGLWGATIPEYLEWYRRRRDHVDRWENWSEEGIRRFVDHLRERYPRVYQRGIPKVCLDTASSPGAVRIAAPFPNRLRRDRPRLLMIIPWMVMGGADKFNLDLLEQLTRRGWEVTLAAQMPSDHPWMPEFARYTPDIFALANFLPVCEHPAFLRYMIESRQPDVVLISHSEFGYRVLPFLRTCCRGPAWVDFCHLEEEGWKEGGYPRYAIANQDFLDLNLVTSEHLKNWMVERGADAEQIEVVYINVDPDQWAPQPAVRERVRGELGIRPDEPVLLFVGRLCAQKQPRVLAGTLRELQQRGCAFQGLIVGDGPDRAWLEEFLKSHGLESQVRLLGALGPQRVREMYWASDVLFLPSAYEGIALAIYEAMAAGLPIVGADVGGQREVATPDCAILLRRSDEPTEIQQYANELESLLRDPARRAAMGRAGRLRIEKHFTLELMGQRMLALFDAAQQRGKMHPKPAIPLRLAEEIAAQAVEAARLDESWSWWEQQRDAWERRTQQAEQRVGELELALAELESRAAALESRAAELQNWVGQLERAKAWLEEQRSNWEQAARASEETVRELRNWTAELEKAKAWLSEQVEQQQAALRTQGAQLDTLRQRVERCRRRWVYRVLTRLGLLERLDGE